MNNKRVFSAVILGNEAIHGEHSNYFRMSCEFLSPAKAGIRQIKPGQFAHLKLNGRYSPLLRRPFTIFEAKKNGAYFRTIDFVYKVVGSGTRYMADLKPGAKLDIMAPLGNGYSINKNADVNILVGGGVGMACLYLLLKQLKGEKWLFIGTRSETDLCLLSLLQKQTPNIIITTEDGSCGKKGLVTEALNEFVAGQKRKMQIYACGPTGMNCAVQKIAVERRIPAQISLEERMGCGIGLCRVCVCKTKNAQKAQGWGWKTVCEDGPVFEANQLIFS